MPTVTLGTTALHYREQGTGSPPVLLIHCAGGSSRHFVDLLGLLSARGARAVALDLPGHGASPPSRRAVPPSELLESYRDRVVDAAEALGLGRFVLVGHSMGGAVAQLIALSAPERVMALVLVATAARLKVAPPVLAAIRNSFSELPSLMAAVGYAPESDRSQVQAWASLQVQAPQEVVLADFLACAEFDLRQRVGTVDCPTLVLSAADDLLTPPKLQEQLADLIRQARLKTISRAGHFVIFERPDRVAELIMEAVHGAAQAAFTGGEA